MNRRYKILFVLKIISVVICWGLMNLLAMNFGAYKGIISNEKIIDSKIEYQKSTKGWITGASINILTENNFFNIKCKSYANISAYDLNFKEYFFDSIEERTRLQNILISEYAPGNYTSLVKNWVLLGKARYSEPSAIRTIFSVILFSFLMFIPYFLFNKWKIVFLNLISIPLLNIFFSCF